MSRFGLILSRVGGPPCLGLTLGWDTPTRPWKPYLTLEFLGWIACLGWSHLLNRAVEQHCVAEDARHGVAYAMRRDYWADGAKVAAAKVHDCGADEERRFLFPNLLEEVGIRDGDEFELVVTATGRRPHGDRRFIRDSAGQFRAETDDECLRRIWDAPVQPAAC